MEEVNLSIGLFINTWYYYLIHRTVRNSILLIMNPSSLFQLKIHNQDTGIIRLIISV